MLHESLWRAWSVQKRAVPISPAMYFSSDGLALGAGTILLSAVGPRRLADLQGEEARLLALLSAAYGKAISPSVLGNIERAAKCWREGDDDCRRHPFGTCGAAAARRSERGGAPALCHRRLHQGGHESDRDIASARSRRCAISRQSRSSTIQFEPRVPAGNGILSGRWTKILSFLGDLTATQGAENSYLGARRWGSKKLYNSLQVGPADYTI